MAIFRKVNFVDKSISFSKLYMYLHIHSVDVDFNGIGYI